MTIVAPHRVLVVEDDLDTLDTLVRLIRDEIGFDVVTAVDGVEALRIVDSDEHLNLVFSDIMMPGMDGLTLSDEVRKRRPHLPVVLATGLPSAIDSAVDRGAIALVKPYTYDHLAAVLREQLIGKRISSPRSSDNPALSQ